MYQSEYYDRAVLIPAHADMPTWFIMILQSSMYLRTCMALGSSRELNCSKASKKYEKAVL